MNILAHVLNRHHALDFSVHAKHCCEELWRNWKKVHPVWTFLQAVEITETLNTVWQHSIDIYIYRLHHNSFMNIKAESAHWYNLKQLNSNTVC
jgi:hypothetical protein